MSTHNNLDKICVAIVICSLVLTVLFMNGEALGITKIVDEDAEQNSDSAYFTTKVPGTLPARRRSRLPETARPSQAMEPMSMTGMS